MSLPSQWLNPQGANLPSQWGNQFGNVTNGSSSGSSSWSTGSNVQVPDYQTTDFGPKASGAADYNYNDINQVKFRDLPKLGELDFSKLNDQYSKVPDAYDSKSYINTLNKQRELGLTTGLQSANAAASGQANQAAQQGGQISSDVLRAQLLLPYLKQNADLATQGEAFKADSKRGAISQATDIASKMTSLQNSYLGTLANYNTARASNRLNTAQMNVGIQQANNAGNYQEQVFGVQQNQWNQEYNLNRAGQFANENRNMAQFGLNKAQFQEGQGEWQREFAARQAALRAQQGQQAGGQYGGSGMPPVGLIPYYQSDGTANVNNQTFNDNQLLRYPNNPTFPIYNAAGGSPDPIGVPRPWMNQGNPYSRPY